MKGFLVAAFAGLMSLAACANSPSGFDALSVPRELDARGISFGVGRVPGHNALTFKASFKLSSAGDEAPPVTEEAFLEAAQTAAPAGCTLKTLTPTPDGGRRADYQC